MYNEKGDFMEKNIGIIVATPEEMEAVKAIMDNKEENIIYGLKFYKGKINNNDCILVQCGVGKVNAARTTQSLIDNFQVKEIINVGVAGGLKDILKIGDIVVGKELVQHDFDITAFGHEKGYISETGKIFKSDSKLIEKCEKIKIDGTKIIVGNIASGDIFCTDEKMKEKIHKKFQADCVEMEGAAIAQVSYLSKIPFVVIRSISDIPNGKNHIDYNEFVKLAAKNCAEFVKKMQE